MAPDFVVFGLPRELLAKTARRDRGRFTVMVVAETWTTTTISCMVARNASGRGGSRTSPVVAVFSCLPTFSGIWEPRASVATLLIASDRNGPRRITNVAIGKHGAVVRQLRTLFDVGTIRELTDGQLLERFATGGGEAAELAFAALVERHGPMVLRVCRGVSERPARRPGRLSGHLPRPGQEGPGALGARFAGAVALIRSPIAPRRVPGWPRPGGTGMNGPGRRCRTEACLEPRDDELERVLHEEIERLPERFRAPLVLCDLEGRSHEQAARHLGWPVGTVKSRQARGRDRLRDRLRRRGVAPSGGAARPRFGRTSRALWCLPLWSIPPSGQQLSLSSLRTIVPGTAAALAQGVLSSMYLAQWLKVVSVRALSGRDRLAASGCWPRRERRSLAAGRRARLRPQARRSAGHGGQARQTQCHRD